MDETQKLAEQFEAHRPRLRAMATRMLASASEADDALQEAWLRASRADRSRVGNLDGWLTTVVGRVCLDLLRSRRARREEPLDDADPEAVASGVDEVDPERAAQRSDAVGRALLVVLESLSPAERVAYVLHDLFAVPFDDIAPIVGRTPAATRQLGSRARRRIQGASTIVDPDPDPVTQRRAVSAFLAAARNGDFDGLLAVLDPDVVARADEAAVPPGAATTVRGSAAVARQALAFGGRAGHARLALVDGAVGVVVAARGRLTTVLTFTVVDDAIVEVRILADRARIDRLDVATLD